jgi:hypothetical protein
MGKETLCILVCMLLIASGVGTSANAFLSTPALQTTPLKDGTEYWAVLVGVNEFKNQPYMTNQSLFNGEPPTDLYNVLLTSDHWRPDHIRLLTGKNASIFNVFKGFRWMHRMADSDDVCLFYVSTHGSPFYDLFPYDENGGEDSLLYMYDTYRTQIGKWPDSVYLCFPTKLYYLFDDTVNTWLSNLRCKGVCVIIEACYSGGFNDPPRTGIQTRCLTSDEWMKNLGKQLSAPGRVVLMACKDDELSNGNFFGYYLMEGLQGFGDANKDGMCSVEEAFDYSVPKTQEILQKEFDFPMHPQIYDSYPGELILTDTEMPPSCTKLIAGSLVGNVNIDQTYSFNASDPENDHIKYLFKWGDTTEDWTGLISSDEPIEMTHRWTKEGTYNVLLRNYDEHGMWFFEDSFPRKRIVVTIQGDHHVDQRQTELYDGLSLNDGMIGENWNAQSFIPTQNNLTKIELELIAKGNVQPITVSIRKNMAGPDLIESSVLIGPMDLWRPILNWTTFDFPDIQVTPGETYYIVCHAIYSDDSLYGWAYAGASYDDPYSNGQAYISNNHGSSWTAHNKVHDFSFVTYGS